MKSKWFIGKLKENEFALYTKAGIIKCEIDTLPEYINDNSQCVIKCPYNLSDEQFEILRRAWGKIYTGKNKMLLLEGGIELEIGKQARETIERLHHQIHELQGE